MLSIELWFLRKLVLTSMIVVPRFLLLGAGHFNSGKKATETKSFTELNNIQPTLSIISDVELLKSE